MNFELGEEEKAFIAVINDLCKKEIPGKHIDKVKYLDELDIEEARRQGNLREILRERLPWDFLKKAHDVGIRTLTVPAKYGGGGIGLFTEMVVSEALGRWGGVAVLSSEPYAFCNCMRTFASEELQDEIFPQIMENYTLLTSTAITEPDAGTDTHIPYDEPGAGMKTFAYAEGDEYVINGEKAFCTGGGQADFITLFARTDKNAPISKGMSAFLVPTKSPGVSVVRVNDMIMNELRRNTDLLFENVRIPKRYLIGKENEGYALWEAFRVLVIRFAGAEVGAFQKMYELTKEYATTRIQGGKPIIEHVNIGSRILDMRLRLEALRAFAYKTAWEYDQIDRDKLINVNPLMSNLLHVLAKETALKYVEHVAEIYGGMAVMKEMPIEGFIRGMFKSGHELGTISTNVIRSLKLL